MLCFSSHTFLIYTKNCFSKHALNINMFVLSVVRIPHQLFHRIFTAMKIISWSTSCSLLRAVYRIISPPLFADFTILHSAFPFLSNSTLMMKPGLVMQHHAAVMALSQWTRLKWVIYCIILLIFTLTVLMQNVIIFIFRMLSNFKLCKGPVSTTNKAC